MFTPNAGRARITQAVEHWAFNLVVQGSSPCSGVLFRFIDAFGFLTIYTALFRLSLLLTIFYVSGYVPPSDCNALYTQSTPLPHKPTTHFYVSTNLGPFYFDE